MVPPRPVRRLLLPVVLGLQLVLLVMAAVVAVGGVLGLAVDRRLRALRVAAVAGAYVLVEWGALALLAVVWLGRPLRSPAWADTANTRILGWALGRLHAAAGRTIGFRVEVTDPLDGRPLSETTPVLALARHGGIGDSLALVWLLIDRYHRCPRIVLKDVLAWDPLADVVLGRLGACFVPPPSRRRVALDGDIGALAARLETCDALLLFPEGKNWTPGRWRTAIRRLWSEHKPAQARNAALMEHVLPPRWGGVLACLAARPDVPVVVVAHTGLDEITTVRRLWAALPFRSAMTVRWWPAPPPPAGDEDRTRWLVREWAVVDEWIDSRRAG